MTMHALLTTFMFDYGTQMYDPDVRIKAQVSLDTAIKLLSQSNMLPRIQTRPSQA